MATFILVHGAGHGGWCWEKVQPILESHGHKVCAPDLPGLGKDHTIFALVNGKVEFKRRSDDRVHVSVAPLPAAAE